jgi:hypothetical protein
MAYVKGWQDAAKKTLSDPEIRRPCLENPEIPLKPSLDTLRLMNGGHLDHSKSPHFQFPAEFRSCQSPLVESVTLSLAIELISPFL